jgi:ketosteroid isomerase-like protein
MKKLVLLAMLFTAIQSAAQTKDEQTILAILEKQTQSWNCGDLTGFMNGYWKNDSLMFIGKSGITYGYDQTLANYRKGYPDMDAMGELELTIIKMTKLAPDAYYIIGKWHLTREKDGDVGGHYTLLFRKIKGQWVIVADHSS